MKTLATAAMSPIILMAMHGPAHAVDLERMFRHLTGDTLEKWAMPLILAGTVLAAIVLWWAAAIGRRRRRRRIKAYDAELAEFSSRIRRGAGPKRSRF
ncbi:hypothetical protein [Pseudohoeflea coraliihabitans]|uniref:Uncharacterized protein n=1 Tax=Pseudohoeflea coraliihabitans TaxID=2860393 RepID=A0ABS6WJC8_9HYPH|nr:hypothetical protein [Pseudohoeflea sp. DP4N28-3]MBW3095870.1 hypothetical protein [Pseudohoeflea sp. DP4N28-3]